ncbi:MAG: hypothetical protein LLG06_07515 [Desulfobacteraceae bacterium]|nr:hypothetical protein [Desulfobacteraceae bacterium]
MKTVRLLLAMALVLSFIACTPAKKAEQLTGNWQSEDGKETIFLLKGGKVSLVSGPATITSTYKVSGPGKLEISLGMFGNAPLQYALSTEGLAITDTSGKTTKYTRIKEAAPAPASAQAPASAPTPAPAPDKK